MENISAGQVVLATFPFSDLQYAKLRPCFVLGLAEFGDVILCQITSQTYDSRRTVTLSAADFTSGSIVQDSFIRPDKLATLDKKLIRQTLGQVHTAKLTEVRSALQTFLEL